MSVMHGIQTDSGSLIGPSVNTQPSKRKIFLMKIHCKGMTYESTCDVSKEACFMWPNFDIVKVFDWSEKIHHMIGSNLLQYQILTT